MQSGDRPVAGCGWLERGSSASRRSSDTSMPAALAAGDTTSGGSCSWSPTRQVLRASSMGPSATGSTSWEASSTMQRSNGELAAAGASSAEPVPRQVVATSAAAASRSVSGRRCVGGDGAAPAPPAAPSASWAPRLSAQLTLLLLLHLPLLLLLLLLCWSWVERGRQSAAPDPRQRDTRTRARAHARTHTLSPIAPQTHRQRHRDTDTNTHTPAGGQAVAPATQRAGLKHATHGGSGPRMAGPHYLPLPWRRTPNAPDPGLAAPLPPTAQARASASGSAAVSAAAAAASSAVFRASITLFAAAMTG
mmetsp:Transcript_7848/g.31014  ORF Transcript_7848/g.31014 Transcript_7848/m.31014 type:complete len:306 (+) Transcript_7848:1152-2069(+)